MSDCNVNNRNNFVDFNSCVYLQEPRCGRSAGYLIAGEDAGGWATSDSMRIADNVNNNCAVQYVVIVKYRNVQTGHVNRETAIKLSLRAKNSAPTGAAHVSNLLCVFPTLETVDMAAAAMVAITIQ